MLSAVVLSALTGLILLVVGWAAATPSSGTFTGVQGMSMSMPMPAQEHLEPEPPRMKLTGAPVRLPAPRVEAGEIAAAFNRGGVPVLNHNAIKRTACLFTESPFNFFFPEATASQCRAPVLDDAGLRDVVLTRSVDAAAVTVVCKSGGGWLDVRAPSSRYGEIEGIVAAEAVDLRGADPVTCSS
jgi:hypothetical protein